MKKLRPENRHALIQLVAYTLWERRGHPPGDGKSDWYLAEGLVNAAYAKELHYQSAQDLVQAYYDEYA